MLIGTSPLAANAEVKIDPDRLLAAIWRCWVITGSGKLARSLGWIRWSMDEARKARCGADPNARFIVLDPNGEYANTFRDINKVRVYAVEPRNCARATASAPWFWNSAEWSAFTQ